MALTLEEAIIYNEELREGIDKDEMPRCHEAVQLGIEALKRVKANRKGPRVVVYKELPGETGEYIPRNVGILPSDEDSSPGETEGEK